MTTLLVPIIGFTLMLVALVVENDPMAVHTDSNPPNAEFAEIHKLTLIVPAAAPSERAIYVPPTPTPSPTPSPVPTATPAPSQRVYAASEEGFSEAEMRALFTEVGFPEWTHERALFITWCESRWRHWEHNDTPATGDDSYGLAQINIIGTLLPGRLAIAQSLGYPVTTAAELGALLLDPIANLRVAYVLSGGGTGWGAWSCAR